MRRPKKYYHCPKCGKKGVSGGLIKGTARYIINCRYCSYVLSDRRQSEADQRLREEMAKDN